MEIYVLSQILSGLGFLIGNLSQYFKGREKVLFGMALSAGFISAHYYILGDISLALFLLLGSVRFIFGAFFPKNLLFILVFIIISSLIACIFFAGITTILGYVGSIFYTIGSFSRSEKYMRIFHIFGILHYMIANIVLFSVVLIFVDALGLFNKIVAYKIRFWKT